MESKLEERTSLKHRRNTLQQRISFLGILQDLEIMLGIPRTDWDVISNRKSGVTPLRELGEATSIDPSSLTAHCQAFERAAYAWLSLVTDLSCFPVAEGKEGVPTIAAMGTRLQRAEKALLNKLSAVLRTVICPKNLVISIATDQPVGEDVQVKYAPSIFACMSFVPNTECRLCRGVRYITKPGECFSLTTLSTSIYCPGKRR